MLSFAICIDALEIVRLGVADELTLILHPSWGYTREYKKSIVFIRNSRTLALHNIVVLHFVFILLTILESEDRITL